MVSFLNSFLSYIMLMLVIVVVAGVAMTIGIMARKHKNTSKAAADGATQPADTE